MALAVVGVRVKIDGAAQSIAALRAVRREMEALGRAAQSLTKVSIRATRVGDLTSQSGNIQVGDTRNINKTSSAVNNYTKNVTNAAMKTGLFTRAFSLAGAQVRKLGRQITTFGSVLSTLGFRMSALISIPIIGMFAGIVSVASKFED